MGVDHSDDVVPYGAHTALGIGYCGAPDCENIGTPPGGLIGAKSNQGKDDWGTKTGRGYALVRPG